MMVPIIISAVLVCLALLAVMLRLSGAARSKDSTPITPQWIAELSLDRYRPMSSLLSDEDIRCFRNQRGFTPGMEKALRRQRVQIFRGYLHCLMNDYGRVLLAIKFLMVHSEVDRPDLAAILIRNQIAFSARLLLIRSRLLLYSMGFAGIQPSQLLQLFDVMRLELQSLSPAASPTLA